LVEFKRIFITLASKSIEHELRCRFFNLGFYEIQETQLTLYYKLSILCLLSYFMLFLSLNL